MAALIAAACAACATQPNEQQADKVAEQEAKPQKPACTSSEPQVGSMMVRRTCS